MVGPTNGVGSDYYRAPSEVLIITTNDDHKMLKSLKCYICLQYIFCINGNFLLIFYNYIQDKHFIPKHMTHKICFTPTNK